MALSLFENFKEKKPVSIFVGDDLLMQLDAVVSEGHGSSVQITEHPIEDGSKISDHAIIQPLQLSLQVIKTNHPISLKASLRNAGIGLAANLLTPGVKTFGGGDNAYGSAIAAGATALAISALDQKDDDQPMPDVLAYQVFQAVQFNRQPCKIVCELRAYSNMLLESISTTRDASSRNALIASLSFREIKIVKSEKEEIPQDYLKDGKKKSGGATEEKKTGTVSSKAASTAQEGAASSSVAYGLLFGG